MSMQESQALKMNITLLEMSRMASRHLAAGIFLLQTIVGILGNASLLYHYISPFFIGFRLRSTDLIFKHLTIANPLVNLSKGVTQTMPGLGLKDFLNAFVCKHVFYVHKVDRGVSISTTYLLSVFQAIPVRPWSSRWARSKVRALKYIEPSMFLNWMLFLLINLIFFTHVIEQQKKSHGKDFGYFSANFKKKNQSHCLRHIL